MVYFPPVGCVNAGVWALVGVVCGLLLVLGDAECCVVGGVVCGVLVGVVVGGV